MVWYLWAASLALTIPNNFGQSNHRIITWLPKSREKLVEGESQAPLDVSVSNDQQGDIQVYTREDAFVSLPTGVVDMSFCSPPTNVQARPLSLNFVT